jgi:hypothetical protein
VLGLRETRIHLLGGSSWFRLASHRTDLVCQSSTELPEGVLNQFDGDSQPMARWQLDSIRLLEDPALPVSRQPGSTLERTISSWLMFLKLILTFSPLLETGACWMRTLVADRAVRNRKRESRPTSDTWNSSLPLFLWVVGKILSLA